MHWLPHPRLTLLALCIKLLQWQRVVFALHLTVSHPRQLRISQNKTLIIIAHRLSTIKGCNKVFEIKDKKIT
jgi:ABC-type transport system involved in Fe-S cluster assembly fused permease/ATPase subunit